MVFAATQKELGVDLTRVFTQAEIDDGLGHVLGTTVRGDGGEEFTFIRANGAIALNDNVAIDGGFDCPVAGAAGRFWAVASVAALADNEYGFVQTKGMCTANVKDAQADNSLLARTLDANGDLEGIHATGAAAGDSDVVATSLSTVTAGLATIYIY